MRWRRSRGREGGRVPEAPLVEGADRPEDALQGPSELPVRAVAEALEVDLVERHPGAYVVEDLRSGVAVRDVGAHEPLGQGLPEDRHRPLAGDERLVVGRG